MLLVIVFVLCIAQVYSVGVPLTQGHCAVLDASERLYNPCVGVVNYPFWVRPGGSLSAMAAKASTALSSLTMTQLSSTCVSQLVSYTCSQIYWKCNPGVAADPTNSTLYNYQVYSNPSLGLPFQRPCVSVCANVFQPPPAVKACSGTLFPMIGTLPNCSARIDYSLGNHGGALPYVFDRTPNSPYCFVPQNLPVAGAVEQYRPDPDLKNAPCSGLVDKFVIPPANRLNASFTLLQPPGVVQRMLNLRLGESFSKFPAFIQPECYYALQKFLCYSTFLKPFKNSLKQALSYSQITLPSNPMMLQQVAPFLPMNLTVPSYPEVGVCEDFNLQCRKLLPMLMQSSSALNPDCNRTVNGAHIFPIARQTVSTIVVNTAVLKGTVKFYSDPNTNLYYNETQVNNAGYEASCPTGYVIPEHPDNEDVRWIGGTACAMGCLSPIWTPDEWDAFDRSRHTYPVVGAIIGLVFIAFILVTQSLKDTYMLLIYAILALIASFASIHAAGVELDKAVCYDNAVQTKAGGQDQADAKYTPCVIQAGILVYTFVACAATIFATAIDWRLKKFQSIQDKIWGTRKNAALYVMTLLLISVILPLITVIYAAAENILGGSRSLAFCFIRGYPNGPKDADLAVVVVPVILLCILFIITFFGHDFCGILFRKPLSSQTSERSEETPVHTPFDNAVHIAVGFTILVSLIVFLPYCASKLNGAHDRDTYLESLTEWTRCLFTNYNSIDPNHCFEVCGDHPSTRPMAADGKAQLLFLAGNMVIIGPAYMVSFLIAYLYYRNNPSANYSPVSPNDRRVITSTKIVPVSTTASELDQPVTIAQPMDDEKMNGIEMGTPIVHNNHHTHDHGVDN